MTDFQQQRQHMLERQLRPVGVLNAAVLAAFALVAREDFVPPAYRDLAYADVVLPLDEGQEMLKPGAQGQMLQALNLKASDHVLEVGTGTGYLTALLAQLAHRVVSVEISEPQLLQAQQNLLTHHCANVQLKCGDYAQGPDTGLYDAIVITGALRQVDPKFYRALRPGGRMVAILGVAPLMYAYVIQEIAGQWQCQPLFELVTPYLTHAVLPDAFHF